MVIWRRIPLSLMMKSPLETLSVSALSTTNHKHAPQCDAGVVTLLDQD